jgi:hypothetical protein
VIWNGILYGGPDILGACGSPDYLVSRHGYGRIVVPMTMFFIDYSNGDPEIYS